MSAAWVLAIVAVLTFIIGALMLTVVDPVMQALFDSTLWSSSTQYGTQTLGWVQDLWLYFPVFILITILLLVWIRTRQPTAG